MLFMPSYLAAIATPPLPNLNGICLRNKMSSYWKEKALVENPFFENIGQNLCASTNATDVKFQVLNLQSLSCS